MEERDTQALKLEVVIPWGPLVEQGNMLTWLVIKRTKTLEPFLEPGNTKLSH